jgi:hypothetical protein
MTEILALQTLNEVTNRPINKSVQKKTNLPIGGGSLLFKYNFINSKPTTNVSNHAFKPLKY